MGSAGVTRLYPLGTMPSLANLNQSGVQVGKGKGKANPVAEAVEILARAGAEGEAGDTPTMLTDTNPSLVQMGCGLPALPRKLLEKIEADEYVDFGELPPAKGKGRSMTQAFDGQIVVVQAADLIQARRLIPDLATWMQCFGLFMAAVARRKPGKIPDLAAYMQRPVRSTDGLPGSFMTRTSDSKWQVSQHSRGPE